MSELRAVMAGLAPNDRDQLVQSCTRLGNEREQFLADRDRLAAELAETKAELSNAMSDLSGVNAILDAERAELAQARADAERYRWLKHEALPHLCIAANGVPTYVLSPLGSDFDVDAAIDAARATDRAENRQEGTT